MARSASAAYLEWKLILHVFEIIHGLFVVFVFFRLGAFEVIFLCSIQVGGVSQGHIPTGGAAGAEPQNG